MKSTENYFIKLSGELPSLSYVNSVANEPIRIQVIDSITGRAQSDYPVSVAVEEVCASSPNPDSPKLSLMRSGKISFEAISVTTSDKSPHYATVWVKGGHTYGVRAWKIVIRIEDGQPPWHSVEFPLSVKSLPDDGVTQLLTMSGEPQFRPLESGYAFGELVVKAVNNQAPVSHAVIHFDITPGASTQLVESSIKTDETGIARVDLVKGNVPEKFVVKASCNDHIQTFHLALGDELSHLELISADKINIDKETPQTAFAFLKSKNADIFWPYADIDIHVSGNFHLVNNEKLTHLKTGEDGSLELLLYCDDSGETGDAGLVKFSLPYPGTITSSTKIEHTL